MWLLLTVLIMSLEMLLPGSESVQADEASRTEPASLRLTVQAINNFAGDLYRQLTREDEKSNLFFSPYSVSSALTMVVEGARGETARQMGSVLRFPDTARRVGGDAESLPWDTTLMHTGMAELRQRLTGGVSADAAREIRDKIKTLEREHQALTKQIQQLSEPEQWQERLAVSQRAATVADELNRLRQQVDQYELQIANALWGEQTFPFRPQFLDILRDAYGAAAFSVDFIHAFEAARIRINQWVEEQTRGRIKNPLEPGSLSDATRLVLANAIYFKGNWAEQFNKADTYTGNFALLDGTNVKARFMAARKAKFRYAELLADGVQLLELPYRGHTLSMLALLPKDAKGLPSLEGKLTADNLNRWVETMREQKVHVFLPKFTIETTYYLRPTLSSMGMPAAFAAGGFTGMSDAQEASRLKLSEVIHKAFVDVNEEGSEAAAVTLAITVAATSGPRREPPIPVFRADHPFLFLIRDTQSGTILFLGRVMNP